MILVVGGANLDSTVRTAAPAVLHTSNPAAQTQSAGGVGRNIAENLARLGQPVSLIAAMGDDPAGHLLAESARALGIDTQGLILSPRPTGSYVAVLDDSGELVIGVSDMSATDSLTVEDVAGAGADRLVSEAEVVVLDGNLPAPVCRWLIERAAVHGIPVIVDPVSVAKAVPFADTLDGTRPLLLFTPNVDELAAVLGRAVADDDPSLATAAAELHARGVEHVWIRRGRGGSVMSTSPAAAGATDAAATTAPDAGAADATGTAVSEGVLTLHRLAAPECLVEDVTGAGDSMTAGFVHAWVDGSDVVTAARFGQAVASLTVESRHTVRPDLTAQLVHARLAQSQGDR